jgi:hypothetical protein
MINVKTTEAILRYEWIGFGAVIALLWLDEILDLPCLILGVDRTPVNYGEILIETLLVLPLAIAVTWSTRHLLLRIKHLEGLMHVCAYCNKVREGDTWIPMEEYIHKHSQAELSKTFCMECLLKVYESKDKKQGQ